MAITRLKNIQSTNTGRILYVSPDDFDASDAISNRGNSPLRPFKTIQRALIEAARFSYVPGNSGQNDKFDSFTIMIYPGEHIIDNRPGLSDASQVPILTDTSNYNLLDPDNDLYKFNSTRGGCIVPRGTSLVGMDLRKTKIIPKYIPDPTATDGGTIRSNYPNTGVLNSGSVIVDDDTRSSVFKVTGGCYFWQFTFFDGDKNGVYTGAPNPSGVSSTLVSNQFSHHKLTNFEYACFYDLSLYYQKLSRGLSQQGIPTNDPLGQRTEENRIVGPGGIQADTTRISAITFSSIIATATTVKASDGVTRVSHGFSVGSQIRVFNSDDAVSGVSYNGTYLIVSVGSSLDDDVIDQFSYQLSGVPNANAQKLSSTPFLACELETDTVDSASPYIFNCSIRSIYGICGMHANGALATGFKSMVVAQYTGICLQKDDRAFVRACPVGSTNYQDGSVTTCGTTILKPAHQDINSYYKKNWRNYHIKASNDGYIQVVSVFAVGFADQFITESGGDMSIANSDSNFGNTALKAKGFKATAFTKDVSGVITHILPPQTLPTTPTTINWLPFDIQLTRSATYNPNGTKLFIYGAGTSTTAPVTNVLGYTVGAKTNDVLSVTLGNTLATATVNPSGAEIKSVGIGQVGSPIQWDNAAQNWYISVNAGSSIVSTLQQSQYANPNQITTPVSFYTRIVDSRTPNDKIYRLRLEIPSSALNASPPQTGFIIQPLGGVNSYTNTYYIFDVEEYQKFIPATQNGIYYLTVLLGNISPTAANFDDTKFSQNVDSLYPNVDLDNPLADATASRSIADNVTIGKVTTTNGSSEAVDRSITREALIRWCKEANNSYTVTDNSNTYNTWDNDYSLTVNSIVLTARTGNTETRLINTPDVNVELRRPSIIRAGNQTFEYTGFGPGNYSTGFPSRQTKVLTADEVRLSQSVKENGGIAFYSGLNSDGDLYIGNTVINPVTGTTTTVNNPTTSSALDPNSPVFTNITATNTLTVLGGTSSNTKSNIFGPLAIGGNLEINPTWNSPSIQLTSLKVNVTDTASASNSNLLDLQVTGVSKFSVDKNGNAIITGTLTGTGVVNSITTYARQAISISNAGSAGSLLSYNNTSGLITFGTPTLQQVSNSGASTSTALSITNGTTSSSSSTGALVVSGGVGIGGALNVTGVISGNRFTSTVSTGTAPLTVNSTTQVANLNSSFLQGYQVGTSGSNNIVLRDGSGNFSASTITATLSGNASTATALQTARNINGTSFNGSSDITTANWGTSRTITIGSTGKSVNGSANVSWTLSEIGAPATNGSGAFGTWSISISGSASSASTAGTATNLSGGSVNATSGSFSSNLSVSGSITAGGDITAFSSSDKRLKNNVLPIQNALNKVESISGNTFTWNENSDKFGINDVGVIAQEIQKVIPEIVVERDNGYLAVRYEKLVPLLIESIKELSEKVRKLEDASSK